VPPTCIDAVVTEAARRHGDRIAWAMADNPFQRVTYREVAAAVEGLAAGLAARGVGEGDRVVLVLPPGLAWPLLHLAAARLGAATAGINHRLTAAERSPMVARVRPRLVIAARGDVAGLADVAGSAASAAWDVVAVDEAAGVAGLIGALGARDDPRGTVAAAPPPPAADPDRPVAICFTSGTTGTPKAAVFGWRQIEAITTIDTGWRWSVGGVGAMTTSFAHLGPMTKLAGSLVRGGTTHILARWTPSAMLELVERAGVSVVGGVPTQIAMLLDHPDLARRDLSSVQMVVVGGAPATPTLLTRTRAAFNAPVCVRYSCTEAGIGLGTSPDDPVEVMTSTVGLPHAGVEVAVRDGSRDCAPGEVGNVLLRSAAAMSGYLDDPAATADAFTDDGWVRTGDVGWLDEDRRLHLAGRRGDEWIRGGHNVHPSEVEAVLADHPGIRAVAVVDAPDDVFGQVGAAFVVARHGAALSLDDLRLFAGDRLATHKLPERLHLVDALPQTPGNKLDRGALRAVAAANT